MSEHQKKGNIRERLILAGIDEIDHHSLADFSVRRIAQKCGLSCAAPYKHFKDRNAFIAAIIEYSYAIWQEEFAKILIEYQDDTRKQVLETCVSYVKFLVENPHMRAILMMKDDEFDRIYGNMRSELSDKAKAIIQKYCMEFHMDEETRDRKVYMARAMMYGAVLMFDNHEMEYNEKNLENFRYYVNREFDLP